MKISKKSVFKAVSVSEDSIVLIVFTALAIIPTLEVISRLGGFTIIPASPVYVQHLTLWIGFVGAVLATRKNKLLALTVHPIFAPDETFHFGRWLSKSISFLVLLVLLWGTLQLVYWEYQFPINIAPGIPRWVAQLIMPLGLTLMLGQILYASGKTINYRLSMLLVAGAWALVHFTGFLNFQGWFIWLVAGIIIIWTNPLLGVVQGILYAAGIIGVVGGGGKYRPIGPPAEERESLDRGAGEQRTGADIGAHGHVGRARPGYRG